MRLHAPALLNVCSVLAISHVLVAAPAAPEVRPPGLKEHHARRQNRLVLLGEKPVQRSSHFRQSPLGTQNSFHPVSASARQEPFVEPLDATKVLQADSLSNVPQFVQQRLTSDQVNPTKTILRPHRSAALGTGTSRQGTESGFLSHIIPNLSFGMNRGGDNPVGLTNGNGQGSGLQSESLLKPHVPTSFKGDLRLDGLVRGINTHTQEFAMFSLNVGKVLVHFLEDYLQKRPPVNPVDPQLQRAVITYIEDNVRNNPEDYILPQPSIDPEILRRRRNRLNQGLPAIGAFESIHATTPAATPSPAADLSLYPFIGGSAHAQVAASGVTIPYIHPHFRPLRRPIVFMSNKPAMDSQPRKDSMVPMEKYELTTKRVHLFRMAVSCSTSETEKSMIKVTTPSPFAFGTRSLIDILSGRWRRQRTATVPPATG